MWPEVSLDHLGYVSRGRSRHRPRNDPSLYDGPYPFIQTAEVKAANLRICSHSQTYSEKGFEQSRLWPENTLCITIAANIADTALLSYPACFPDSIIGFVADESKCDVRYVKYYFNIVQEHMRMVSHGATQDNLSQDKLLRFGIPCPPLETQHAISETLAAYDDLIEINRCRIDLLEESARLLYREWFVNLRFPSYETAKFKDGLPEGWAKMALSDLAFIVMGQSPESKFYNNEGEGLPFHQGVSDFGDHIVSHKTYTTQATRIAEAGDILCSVRAPVGRLNLTCDKVAIGRGLSAMRSRAGHQSLLLYQLKALFVEEDMIGGGTIFASVTKKELYAQQLLQPDFEIAAEFNRLASEVDEQIETLVKQNRLLVETRDSLLPKLMSGEIQV